MPVKTMARPRSSAAPMTSSSRWQPHGWITAVAALGGGGEEAVGEREEGVGRHHGADRRGLRMVGGGLTRLPGGDARRIDAAHLGPAPMPTVALSLA